MELADNTVIADHPRVRHRPIDSFTQRICLLYSDDGAENNIAMKVISREGTVKLGTGTPELRMMSRSAISKR